MHGPAHEVDENNIDWLAQEQPFLTLERLRLPWAGRRILRGDGIVRQQVNLVSILVDNSLCSTWRDDEGPISLLQCEEEPSRNIWIYFSFLQAQGEIEILRGIHASR